MTITAYLKRNTYIDSVTLMTISSQANNLAGVKQAMIGMGTDMNKEVILNVNLMVPVLEGATTSDLMVVVETDKDIESEKVKGWIEDLFNKKDIVSENKETVYSTIPSAINEEENIAVISVNGMYAAREARIALENGLHVMLFSDNVKIEDEILLKKMAHENELLMMGPDCGTAIINNVGLCFANTVRKGNIGIVAASGTGSQEMSVRIHEFGYGISQLIGTGGRDLSKEVGGIMMIDGIRALEKDSATEVIVLVSKPPAAEVESIILDEVNRCTKPVIVWFLGGNEERIGSSKAIYAKRSKEAAILAVLQAGAQEEELDTHPLNIPLIEEVQKKLKSEQCYIRGLFCGGTLCDEAMLATMEYYDNVYSNIHPDKDFRIGATDKSRAHTFIDFGSDEFTAGKPHPMIDPSTRIQRFMEEAADPEVGVILLDFVLGYGAHENPVGIMAPYIKKAKSLAQEEGRHLEIIGYVLGTELDDQDIYMQNQILDDLGVTLSSSSQNLGLLARGFVKKDGKV